MYPTYVLQWWFRGQWNEIGWRASTPRSLRDLESHAQRMADASPAERYRLTALSPFIGGDPEPVRTFVSSAATS